MTAVIIENEYMIDEQVTKFLNANPTLFTDITPLICCRSREVTDVVEYILKNDAVITASTFMYLDQLRDFIAGFLNPKLPNKIIFVNDITNKLNEWKYSTERYLREEDIFASVKQMLERGHTVYAYDGYNKPHGYTKVLYSTEHDLFYNEDDKDAGYGLEMCIDVFKKA